MSSSNSSNSSNSSDEKTIPNRGYASLTNHYQTKFIEQVKATAPADELWLAIEKVHGSNTRIAIRYDPQNIKTFRGSRTIMLSKDTEFYGLTHFEDLFQQSFKDLSILLKDRMGSDTVFTVFFEIYGGYWNTSTPFKAVQKGIYYSPKHEIIAIDLRIGDEQNFIPHTELVGLLTKVNIPVAKPSHTGTLDELLKLSPVFKSTIPSLLGYDDKDLGPNEAEGWVLKPNITRYLNSGERVMLKLKNPSFLECDKSKSTNSGKNTSNPSLMNLIQSYATTQRLDNVKSKLLPEEKDTPSKWVSLFKADVLDDLNKSEDLTSFPKKEIDECLKKVMNNFVKKVMSSR